MFGILSIVSFIGTGVQLIKEASQKPIPAENWGNKELYNQDVINGVPVEQRVKNAESGKYKLKEAYPSPHRDVNGKIIIENSLLFEKDKKNYGVVQAYKWAEQGRYNLSSQELKKEQERIKAEYDYLLSL